jgi:hypothetical protein
MDPECVKSKCEQKGSRGLSVNKSLGAPMQHLVSCLVLFATPNILKVCELEIEPVVLQIPT